MKLYDELVARGLIAQVTNEDEIREMIDNGKIANVRELANILNVNESYVARTIRLSMLSPEIIHRAIRGTLPPDISLAKLYKLSSRWEEQLQQLGIAVE